MTSIRPGLTLSSTDGEDAASLRLSDSPRLEAHRPPNLKLTSLEQSDDENFPSKSPCSYLKIPSPTYRIMFTPTFLIHSHDSEDDYYSDGLSSSMADIDHANDIISPQRILPLWSSRAEHVKPLVNRFISEETRQHNSVRLAWRSALEATTSESYGSSTTSSEIRLGLDSVDTQSSFGVSCQGNIINPISGKHELFSSLRRTKSLAELSTKRLPKTRQLTNSFLDYAFNCPHINKENEIKLWVSAVSVN